MKALRFAAAMEQAIAGNLQQLRGGCSADLTEVMERLITSQQAFLQLLARRRLLKTRLAMRRLMLSA